jgi:4'-phosphopantetheinyl transferase
MSTRTPAPSCFFPASIPNNELHLWCVIGEDIHDPDFIRQNEVHLCDWELVRAERFHRPQDRHHFVIGRGMLRRALGAYLAIEPRDIVLSQNRYGRPEIAVPGPKPVRFNVSHTEGIVATAFACASEVGVDAERIFADFPHLEVARRHFPPSNYAELERLPASLRVTRFCEYWVLLEAYAKGRGVGLSLSFTNAVFAFDKADHSAIRFTGANEPSERWRFWLMAPSPDHRLAVAASGANDRLVVRRLRPERAERVHVPILAFGESQVSGDA